MQRSYDVALLREAIAPYPDLNPADFRWESWLENKNNLMFEEDGSISLFTFEYPGVYTGHWFFKRGTKTQDLARRMLDTVFNEYGAKVVRGVTKVSLPHAIWAAKKLGFTSYGRLDYPDGEHELLMLTKDEYKGTEN